jgi:hypothetical protein
MRLWSSDRGIVLAEYIISVVLLLVIATAVVQGLVFAASSNASTAMRAQAIELANQCIEQARNLPYDSVGTVSGFPAGIIPDTTVVGNLTVNTVVEWSFDAVTHVETSKSITVVVSWTVGGAGSVTLQSNIVGKTSVNNTGDVAITVVDEDTTHPIQGATVVINAVTGTSNSKATDASGTAMWGQVPSGNLVISGTAAGYVFRLSQVTPASVISNQMNRWTINAAKASSGVVTVKDQSGQPVSGAVVTITGPSGTFTATTAADGTVTFTGIVKGTYTIATSISGYSGGSGSLGVLLGGAAYTSAVTVTKMTTMKVIVKDDLGALLSGVGLTVTPAGAAGPAQTDAAGTAIFTVTAAGPFTVTASKSGYLTGSATSGTMVTGVENALNMTIARILPCTLTVTVVNQASVAVAGATVSVSGPGTVTGPPVTDSSGRAVYTVSMPGVYTAQASKTNYTTGSASTGSIPNGGTAALTVTMPQITTGTLAVKYTTKISSGSKTVYIYNASHALVTTLSFTSKNQVINAVLTAAQYFASSKSPWSSTAVAATVIVNQTVDVSVSSSN